MGSPANSSSLITSPWNPWPLPLSACSQPWLLRLMPRLMPMLSMATMAMATTSAMPTTAMDTTDIPMPTMDTTTARGPLMPRLPPLLRLMLMLSMVSTDMAFPMPAMDTVLPTTTDMPTTDTTAMPTPTDTTMPTVPMDTTATPTATDSDTT